jgi:hypothetical protein
MLLKPHPAPCLVLFKYVGGEHSKPSDPIHINAEAPRRSSEQSFAVLGEGQARIMRTIQGRHA